MEKQAVPEFNRGSLPAQYSIATWQAGLRMSQEMFVGYGINETKVVLRGGAEAARAGGYLPGPAGKFSRVVEKVARTEAEWQPFVNSYPRDINNTKAYKLLELYDLVDNPTQAAIDQVHRVAGWRLLDEGMSGGSSWNYWKEHRKTLGWEPESLDVTE